MQPSNPNVDEYLEVGCGRCPLGGTPDCKVHSWTNELTALREILLNSELTEEVKWGVPCYTVDNGNVIILGAFKDNCVLSFFKGSLMSDPHQLLEKPGPNTRDARVIRFTSLNRIAELGPILNEYIDEAIAIERAGLKPAPADYSNLELPDEFVSYMENDPVLRSAFESLTPGRQRGYILHFSSAKQAETRIARIEKCMPQILSGIGLHDKYKGMK